MKVVKLLSALSKVSRNLSTKASGKLSRLNSVMEARISSKVGILKASEKTFTPALPFNLNSVKEIKQFNKDILGIKHFDIDDYETAKWVTEGLSKFHNDTMGKVKLPKRIKLSDVKASDGVEGFMGYMPKKDTILINRGLIEGAKDAAKTNNETFSQFMQKFGKTSMGGTENYKRGAHQALYHELGHMIHSKTAKNYSNMSRLAEMKALGRKYTHVVDEFLQNKDIQATAGKISEYAQSSPNEFVAEAFSLLAQGKKLPDDVMALYKKYNGPIMDCFNKGNGNGGGNAFHGIIKDFMNQSGHTEVSMLDLIPVPPTIPASAAELVLQTGSKSLPAVSEGIKRKISIEA